MDAAALGAITAGTAIIGDVAGASAKKSAIELGAAQQQLNIQSKNTQEAEQLNKTMAHNTVSASTSGINLGSPSIIAMTTNDFHNYGEDKDNYDIDSQLASLNEQSEKSQVTMGEITGIAKAGAMGSSVYNMGGAGTSPSQLSQSSASASNNYLSNGTASNAFLASQQNYDPYGNY